MYCFEESVFERFHYTDINGFISILENDTLRLSSYRTMNDSMELNWAVDKIIDAIATNCESILDRRFHNEIKSSVKAAHLHAYLACFSAEKDLLSQWRAYGDDGRGFAIGFDLNSTSFELELSRIEPYEPDTQRYFFDVSYDDKSLDRAIEGYIGRFKLYKSKLRSDPDSIKQCADELAIYLLNDAVKYKNPAFSEEKECRMVNFTYKNYNGDFMGVPSRVKFKSSGCRLSSFFEYKFKKSAITEIVLGPKSEIDEKELSLFLHENGYSESLTVSRSSASYR